MLEDATPPDGQQALVAMFQMIMALGPPGVSEESVSNSLEYAFGMEHKPEFALAFDCLFDAQKLAARARWGVRLHPPSGGSPILMHGPKRLGERVSKDDLLAFALALGAFTSPILRAVLALHGWRVEFVEVAEKPAIIKG